MKLAIRGEAASGKSTLAAALIGNRRALIIDADGRFIDQTDISPNITRVISHDLTELAGKINELKKNNSYEYSIIDSITHFLTPIIAGSMYNNDAGKSKNASAGHKDKATAMRVLQGYGLGIENVVYIWHLESSSFANGGKPVTKLRSTVPDTEWERLKHDCHALFTVMRKEEGGKVKRGIKCEWCRFDDGGVIPAAGLELWDNEGKWKGMGDRIKLMMNNSKNGYTLDYLSYFTGKPVGELRAKLKEVTLPSNTDKDGWVSLIKQIKAEVKA